MGYAILVFFPLRDNSLKVISLEELLKYKTEIIKLGGMVGDISPIKITKASIKGSLNDMLDIFIIHCERGYRLKHMVIFEAVLLSFGENFPEEFLKLVSKSVIFTYVRSKGYVPEKHEVIIQLDEDLTESLAKKLIEMYGSNKEEAYSDIYSHPSFHDRRLVDCFLDIVEREESFKVFINSFLAGACKERKDVLASEVIRRFISSDKFESEILDLILNYDLIHSFRQCMTNSGFRKKNSQLIFKTSGFQIIKKAFRYKARKCIIELLNVFDKENNLITDEEKLNVACALTGMCKGFSFLCDIVLHHNPLDGNDWIDVLTRIGELYPNQKGERNMFYLNVIGISIEIGHLDIVLKFLERIEILTLPIIEKLMYTSFLNNDEHLFNIMCKLIKNGVNRLDSYESATLIIDLVQFSGNEDMFIAFLDKFECKFDFCTLDENTTILHVCETNNFSDSTLLRLLLRPEGKFMFNSEDMDEMTPVQCRKSYQYLGHSLSSLVRGVDWKDDTLVVYSSLKHAPILSGFTKQKGPPRSKDC